MKEINQRFRNKNELVEYVERLDTQAEYARNNAKKADEIRNQHAIGYILSTIALFCCLFLPFTTLTAIFAGVIVACMGGFLGAAIHYENKRDKLENQAKDISEQAHELYDNQEKYIDKSMQKELDDIKEKMTDKQEIKIIEPKTKTYSKEYTK